MIAFFYKEETREYEEFIKAVRIYGIASGQCINLDKLYILFGKRVPGNVKQSIKDALGIQNEGGMGSIGYT